MREIRIPTRVAMAAAVLAFMACVAMIALASPALAYAAYTTPSGFYIDDSGHCDIPAGTTVIPANEFDCARQPAGQYQAASENRLRSVTLPDGLLQINDNAFYSTLLSEVTLPDTVTFIGDYAFSWCENLTSVDLGTGLIQIGEFCFANDPDIKRISIPDSVQIIGEKAFANTGLEYMDQISGISKYRMIKDFSLPLKVTANGDWLIIAHTQEGDSEIATFSSRTKPTKDDLLPYLTQLEDQRYELDIDSTNGVVILDYTTLAAASKADAAGGAGILDMIGLGSGGDGEASSAQDGAAASTEPGSPINSSTLTGAVVVLVVVAFVAYLFVPRRKKGDAKGDAPSDAPTAAPAHRKDGKEGE